MLLLDASLLVGHLRGDASCTSFLRGHVQGGSELCISAVAWAQLMAGEGLDGEAESVVCDLLGLFQTQPVGAAIGARAGRLLRDHGGETTLPPADALVVATALELDCPLATAPARHLPAVAGLVVVRPLPGGA